MAFDITIKDYLREIDEAPLLTADEEREFGRLVIDENDPYARDQLVRSNLRLVVNIAKKYSSKSMSLGDLIEEGNLGLIKAVDYFDPERGIRFSTYAAWWIRQSIKLALLTNVQPVHVPSYMVALINQWKRTAKEVEKSLGRPPEIEEMADIMQLSIRKAKIIYGIDLRRPFRAAFLLFLSPPGLSPWAVGHTPFQGENLVAFCAAAIGTTIRTTRTFKQANYH